MKQFSPIVLFFILLISCSRKEFSEEKDPSAKTILLYIDKSKKLVNFRERVKYGNKAYREARYFKSDSLLYKSLYNKIEIDIIFQQNDSSDFYLKELKKISENESRKAGYYYLRGYYFMNKNLDSSFANYDKAQRKFVSVKQYENAGYNLLMMAEIARISSDFANAENILTEAYRYLKKEKKYDKSIYNSFGLLYHSQGDYDKALQYYKKTFDIADNSEQKYAVKNNIALVYTDKKDYEKSITILDSLNALPSLDLDPMMKAKVLSNLGYSIFLSKKGEGISYLKQAEALQDSINDTFGRLANYLKLSDVYRNENISISKKYATKAYDLAKQLNNGDDKLRALELLIKATNNKSESDKRFSEYVVLNDSINTARQIAKNGFAKIKYDSSEAEKNALQSKLIAERTQANNLLLLVIIAFLIILAFIVYFFMRKKSIIEKLNASYESETRISKKVHDELANDIYNVMNFTGTQDISLPDKKERLLNDLDSVYKRTRDISKENATIETGEQFPLQLKEMLSEYQNDSVNLALRGINDIPWNRIEKVKKIPVYRILQELMVNMTKHSEATIAVISFKTKSRNIEIDYFDNGVGMPSQKIILRNGLTNAENRIIAIGGSFTFENVPQKGLKIKIIFPV